MPSYFKRATAPSRSKGVVHCGWQLTVVYCRVCLSVCVYCVYRGFIGADASLAGFTRRPLLWKVNERSAWTSSYLLSHSYSLLVLISQFLCVLPSPHLSFIFPLFRHLTTLHLLICTANWIKGSFRKVFFNTSKSHHSSHDSQETLHLMSHKPQRRWKI